MRFLLFIVCLLLGEYSLLMELARHYTKTLAAGTPPIATSSRTGVSGRGSVKYVMDANMRRAGFFIAEKGGTPIGPADTVCEVVSVSSGNDSRQDAAALGEAIVFRIRNLETLIERSAKEHSPLVVYVDGMPLKGIGPSAIVREQDEIAFTLLSSGPARALWDKYLTIRGRDHFFTQDVAVTVGLENGKFIAGTPAQMPNFSLVLIRRPIFYFCAVLTLLLFVLFHVVAYKSDILRDGGKDPAEGRKPYSLSRTQMALWFFIVTVSFLLLWVETGRIDTMPFSVVIMLGISAATALGAAMIDVRTKDASGPEHSRDFLFDIISDDHGVCFHRFQMAGWTLVLAVVFFYTVFTELRMPDFDTSILLLMGISSGTYLGYKIPERFKFASAH